jgi:hypothetical protein
MKDSRTRYRRPLQGESLTERLQAVAQILERCAEDADRLEADLEEARAAEAALENYRHLPHD